MGGFTSATTMQFDTFGSKFEHFTGDEDLPFKTLKPGNEPDHFRKRPRIRVVGAVDDGKSLAKLDHLTPHFFGLNFGDRFANLVPRHLVGCTDSNCGNGVCNVVLSE